MNEATYNLAVGQLKRTLREYRDKTVLLPEERWRLITRMQNVREEWDAALEELSNPRSGHERA
jgi:hypothetical protein